MIVPLIIFYLLNGGEKIVSFPPEYQVQKTFTPVAVEMNQPPSLLPVKKTYPRESFLVEVSAPAYIVFDPESGVVLAEKNSKEKRSIASLTKIMTAMVFLKHNPGWSQTAAITEEYQKYGSIMKAKPGAVFTLRELFTSMMTASVNDATQTLAAATGLSRADFVSEMNARARELGLSDTSYTDPTGLYPENQSTVRDIGKLLHLALSEAEIRTASSTRFVFLNDSTDQHAFIETHTNLPLIDSFLNDQANYKIIGSKTGFIDESGYCLAMEVEDKEGHRLVGVIFGSADRDARNDDMKRLITWAYENYAWTLSQ